MPFVIDVIQGLDAFLAVERGWDRMVAQRFANHPFLRHCWFVNYCRAYFPRSPLRVYVAYDGGEMVAAMPIVLGNRRMAGIPLKEARLPAGEHSHVNRLLVGPEQADVAGQFLRNLFETGVDVVYFEDLPEVFPERSWFEAFCRQGRFPLEVRGVRSSPYIPTTGSFEEYRKNLSKKFREILNNRLNRINRAGGVTIKTCTTPDRLEPVLADMQAIAARSWQGNESSGIFSGETNAVFYRELIRCSMDQGNGAVSILYIDEKPAAFEFHILFGTTEYCLKAEYSVEFEALAPGAVLDLELVKRAFASDITVYDLLGYADEYKLRWTSQLTPYWRYFVFNRSAAGLAAHALYYSVGNRLRGMKLLRRAKKVIKGS